MTMNRRYFILRRSEAIFRMDMDDEAQELDTFILSIDGWQQSPRVVGYLIQGDVDLDEITAEEANDLIPEAFRV